MIALFPYMATAIFVAVTIYRPVYRPFTVSSMSSQLLERNKLYWGSISFHYGIVLMLSGHLLALLFLLGILCGAGIATFSMGTGQVSYWFPKASQGGALGVYAGIGNLAPGIFSFLLPVALSGLVMFGSYLAWLIFLVIGAGLYYWLGRNAPYFQLRAQGRDYQ